MSWNARSTALYASTLYLHLFIFFCSMRRIDLNFLSWHVVVFQTWWDAEVILWADAHLRLLEQSFNFSQCNPAEHQCLWNPEPPGVCTRECEWGEREPAKLQQRAETYQTPLSYGFNHSHYYIGTLISFCVKIWFQDAVCFYFLFFSKWCNYC